ncbi:MAG: 5-formyltetrahydrofolate cyclo-ligase [Sphingomicrobium sp.]
MVPSLSAIPADKVALRRIARQRRRAFVQSLGGDQRATYEEQLAAVLDPLLVKSRIIGGYCPMPSEISPLPALGKAASHGATTAFPAFANHLDVLRFLAGPPVEKGPWAVLQPALDAPQVFPDLILVPLVAVDRRGTRLGQGKGHYDRVLDALRRHGALLIGVGWAVQMMDADIVADPWDIPLDGFASPSGVEMFR